MARKVIYSNPALLKYDYTTLRTSRKTHVTSLYLKYKVIDVNI